MTLVAGVDIGNATTEIVIADARTRQPLAWDRARTRGLKGSAEASRAAGLLLSRMQARIGSSVDCAILTHQSPVHTRRFDLPRTPDVTGRLRRVASPSATAGGVGFAVGRPVDVMTSLRDVPSGPIIAVSRDPLGFRATSTAVRHWLDSSIDVQGVLLAGDEAILVSRRLGVALPIVDGAAADAALEADLIALEVAAPGHTCREISDPLRLAASLGLSTHEHPDASTMAAALNGQRSAAIGCLREPEELHAQPSNMQVLFADGTTQDLADVASTIDVRTGSVVGLLDGSRRRIPVSDLWLVDPSILAAIPGLRQDRASLSRVAVSTIERAAEVEAHRDGLRSTWKGEIRIIGSEAAAAHRGALSTPAVSSDALVIDLGGGTIDVIHPSGDAWTGAGSGDLMTMATTIATEASRAAAEWVKRGPAWRIETPHLAIDESGDRRFLDVPATQGSVGWLVTEGPSGDLPFTRSLTGGEWRTMRLALKEQVFGRNALRGLNHLPSLDMSDMVLVGGPAGDDEIVEAMHAVLREGQRSLSIGRANVAGMLGHRWAVAYGLVLLAAEQ